MRVISEDIASVLYTYLTEGPGNLSLKSKTFPLTLMYAHLPRVELNSDKSF